MKTNYSPFLAFLLLTFNLLLNAAGADFILLNEVKMNPPGMDPPYEYIELKGTPNLALADYYVVLLDGVSPGDTPAGNPGLAKLVVNLGQQITSVPGSGMIVIKGATGGHKVPTIAQNGAALGAAVIGLAAFDNSDVIANSAATILLIHLPAGTAAPTLIDYDDGGPTHVAALINDGLLDEAPLNLANIIVDVIGWRRGSSFPGDVIYPKPPQGTTIRLNPASGRPDAATRYAGNTVPNNLAAWFYGALQTGSGGSLSVDYYSDDPATRSAVFPAGPTNAIFLTPGLPNEPNDNNSPGNPTPSSIDPIGPQSLVVGETNVILFTNNAALDVGDLTIDSSDYSVINPANISAQPNANGYFRLVFTAPLTQSFNVFISLRPGDDWSKIRSFPIASLARPPNSTLLGGAGDGSAAIALAGNSMLDGDDEFNAIRLYDRTVSGLPIALFDLTTSLGLDTAHHIEADFEACAQIGNVIYWLGSHSNGPFDPANGDYADARPNRNRFFATTLPPLTFGDTTAGSSGYTTNIRTALFTWNDARYRLRDGGAVGNSAATPTPVAGPDPKSVWGFNFEGMAPSLDNSRMYLGFRAPLVPAPARPAASNDVSDLNTRKFALIAPLNNFPNLVTGNGLNGTPPTFDAQGIELDLGRRGIRDIKRLDHITELNAPGNPGIDSSQGFLGDLQIVPYPTYLPPGYLIVAGPSTPPGDTRPPGESAIYSWDGNAAAPAVTELMADLSGRQPEGITELLDHVYPITGGTGFMLRKLRIIEDNGTYDWYSVNNKTKDFPPPSFGAYKRTRTDVITLGPPVTTAYFFRLYLDELFHAPSGAQGEGFAIGDAAFDTDNEGHYPFVGGHVAIPDQGFVAFTKMAGVPMAASPTLNSGAYDDAILGMNYHSHINVGYSFDGSNRRGVMWSADAITRVFAPLSGGTWSEARGISSIAPTAYDMGGPQPSDPGTANGNNWVVGASGKTGGTGAFIWGETGTTVAELPGFPAATYTVANAINSSDTVVGASGTSVATRTACIWEFLYNSNLRTPINLGTLPNGGASEALAINNNGTVVGYAYTAPAGAVKHACLWARVGSRYQIYDLGVLPVFPAGSSEARGINDYGQIVGNASAGVSLTHGCTWMNARISDLNTRVASGVILSANAINDMGYITGAWAAINGDYIQAYSLETAGQLH